MPFPQCLHPYSPFAARRIERVQCVSVAGTGGSPSAGWFIVSIELEQTTRLVHEIRTGDHRAADQLLPILYNELRSLAAAMFARQPGSHTLQPTALLHEAYLKLVDQSASDITDRAHFFRIAARAMRQVLIDHARAANAAKRGGGAGGAGGAGGRGGRVREQLDIADPRTPGSLDRLDWLALDEAISNLAQVDSRQAAVVEMRFFGGMSVEETAKALDVSPRTVELDWRMARAWLSQSLKEEC
jgi:RNA polymerase sigma-70 factor, ECF subfamily